MYKRQEFGLYAKQMGGGSVDPATGSFNFAVLEGYMIRNGRIAEPVRGATLIGKGAEVLRDIDMVGNNLKRAQGMCGSKSGSIPTDEMCIRDRPSTFPAISATACVLAKIIGPVI